MRREWRNVLVAFILFLLGTDDSAAQQESAKDAPGSSGELVRLTVDVSWGMPRKRGSLARRRARRRWSSDGAGVCPGADRGAGDRRGGVAAGGIASRSRVSALVPAESGRGPGPKGSWRLGREPEGRVRVRIEAPLDAGLVVRGGDQVVTIPLAGDPGTAPAYAAAVTPDR